MKHGSSFGVGIMAYAMFACATVLRRYEHGNVFARGRWSQQVQV